MTDVYCIRYARRFAISRALFYHFRLSNARFEDISGNQGRKLKY